MLLKDNLNGFQHLGIPVTDILTTKQWYMDVLGFEIVYETEIVTPEGNIYLSFIRRGDITLEIYQLVGEDLEEVRARTHGHIDHLAIDVYDMGAALAEAKSKGASLDPATPDGPQRIPQLWSAGVEYVFFTSANGEKVEFNQRLDLEPDRRVENLNGWSHLGIPVADIGRSESFYAQFGFKKVVEANIPVDELEIKISMLELAGFTLEFYQLLPQDLDEIRARSDGFIDHVALDVKDIDLAFAELQNAGITPLEGAPVELPFWENGVKYFNVRGPDGEKVEFNQIL